MIETTVKINGMMCGMCEAHINNTIRSQFAVKKVSSSHTRGQAVIRSEAPLDEAALREAIAKTGYEAVEITAKPMEKGGLFAHFH